MCKVVIIDGKACGLQPNHHNEYNVIPPEGFVVGRRNCRCRNMSVLEDTSCQCARNDLTNPLVLRAVNQ